MKYNLTVHVQCSHLSNFKLLRIILILYMNLIAVDFEKSDKITEWMRFYNII